MVKQIILSILISQLCIAASMLCLQDGWITVAPVEDDSFLPPALSKHMFVSMPEGTLGVEQFGGSMLVCRNASICLSWLVKVLPRSHHNSNRTVVKLTSIDWHSNSTFPAHYRNCSFSIPPCFISLHGNSSMLQRQYNLDKGGSLGLEISVSFVYFNELNVSVNNATDVPANLTQNGTSLNITETMHGPIPEDYMYRIPKSYLQALITLTLPYLGDVYLEEVHTVPFEATLKIHIWQKGLQQGSTGVQLSLPLAPLSCGNETVFKTNVTVGCPPGKSLELLGTSNLTNGSSPSYKLPVNYRPPSSEGHAIALSPHMYNVDPREPIRSSHFRRSKVSYSLKQCRGKVNRSECNCSERMKASSNVAYSDCIDKAYEHAYGTPFALRFVAFESPGISAPVVGNCSYEELNGRTDYSISNSGSTDDWFAVDSGNMLTFKASGLYHFLFQIDANDSFCDLSLYLMVFVTQQPITKSVEFFINILSSMLCGGSLMCVYLCYKRYHKYFHHHHQHHQNHHHSHAH